MNLIDKLVALFEEMRDGCADGTISAEHGLAEKQSEFNRIYNRMGLEEQSQYHHKLYKSYTT